MADTTVSDNVFWSTGLLSVSTCTVLIVLVWHLSRRTPFPHNAPQLWKKDDWLLIGSLKFFSARHSMLATTQKATKSGNVGFFVGKKQVVAIGSDVGARCTFFDVKDLSFIMGNTLLSTQSPPGPSERETIRVSQWFNRMLTAVMKREHLANKLTYITKDVEHAMGALAENNIQHEEWHVIDPFIDIYKLVFRLSNRSLGAFEVAEDDILLHRVLNVFQQFERYDDPCRIIMPYLPVPDHFWRVYYTAKLFLILWYVIKKRNRSGVKRQDTIQYLLDQGCSMQEVVTFEIGSLFAGQINSGVMISWLPIYWSQNPNWKAKVQQEVDNVIAHHKKAPHQSKIDVLGQLTLEDWESSFPLIELSLRESIRLGLTGTDYRKNVSNRDIEIGTSGEVIPPGAFAVFQIDNVHMNRKIYTEPNVFNPDRFGPDRAEDKKAAHSFVGWGSGRHPCLGSRFAKLETVIICAYFVALFDFELSDAQGKVSNMAAPRVDRIANSVKKPTKPLHIRYRARVP